MTDWWLVPAAALALGALVTLFRFIGCDEVFDLEHVGGGRMTT